MKLDIDEVMARADFLYDTAQVEQGRVMRFNGIQSEQVKAIARAIVDELNEVLRQMDER